MVIVIIKKIASDNFILPDTNLKFNQQNYLKFNVEKIVIKSVTISFSKLIMMPFFLQNR
jgi:hypothetical protein